MAIWFLIHPQGLVLRREGGRIGLLDDDEAVRLGARESDAYDLGTLDGRRTLAAAIDDDAALADPLFAASQFELRNIYRDLGEEPFRLAGMANQLVFWGQTHRFCGRCGARTERVAEERAMRCPSCGLLAYPRISPAVIVLVRRGDQALLARGVRFPLPFYSTLAGFVEVGETLEDTVVREVREEVGIEVDRIRYFGSQPWPFPHSLMIGFTAEWKSGEITADAKEIVDAQWFGPDALPQIPPRLSIARRLIDAWLRDVGGPT
jgi:NAD+ diphosphatase